MIGEVLFPGKLWEGGKFGPKVSAKFKSGDEEKNVNAKPGTPKAKFLLSLRRGQQVPLSRETMVKDGEKIHYWDIDVWAVLDAGGPSAKKEKGGKAEWLAEEKKKIEFFQREGIKIAKRVADDLFPGMEQTQVSDDAIFERGGAIGTGLLIAADRR